MALGPSRASRLRDRMMRIKNKSRFAAACSEEDVRSHIPGLRWSYFEATVRCFQQEKREHARQAVYSSRTVRRTRKQEAYAPDVQLKSVESCQYRSDTCYPEGRDLNDFRQDDLGRLRVADTETAPGGGLSAPRIRMSAIADLNEFNGRDRNEDRARS